MTLRICDLVVHSRFRLFARLLHLLLRSRAEAAASVARVEISGRSPSARSLRVSMAKPLVPSRELERDVAGVRTTVCAQRFGQDRVLVLVSQLARVGMLVRD